MIDDRRLDIESRLVESVNRGELLDLAGTEPVDEQSMRGWDESHWVPASLIREILRGRLAPDPDPHGLRLRAARIVGRLDLENLTTSVCLELLDCFLPDGVLARDASMPGLTLERCILEHHSEPPFWADRMRTVGNLVLTGNVIADTTAGAVRLVEAHIGNSLVCSGAKVRNTSGPAVRANGLQVGRAALFSGGFEAVGSGEDGAVGMAGADITSRLDFDGAKIHNESGPAVRATGLQVGRVASFTHGFEAVGAGEHGAMNLVRARIGTRLNCAGAKIRNVSGPALTAESLHTGEDALFRDGFEAVGAGQGPVVRLAGTHIGGALAFTVEGVRNVTHPRALVSLDGLTYRGVPEGSSISQWLALLGRGTGSYAAQPYQQLAAVHRAAGHERDARKILMEQRRHQIHSKALAGRGERALGQADRNHPRLRVPVLASADRPTHRTGRVSDPVPTGGQPSPGTHRQLGNPRGRLLNRRAHRCRPGPRLATHQRRVPNPLRRHGDPGGRAGCRHRMGTPSGGLGLHDPVHRRVHRRGSQELDLLRLSNRSCLYPSTCAPRRSPTLLRHSTGDEVSTVSGGSPGVEVDSLDRMYPCRAQRYNERVFESPLRHQPVGPVPHLTSSCSSGT